MSLNFDVSKVANHEVVTTDPTNPEKWHPTTDALVWLAMICDYNAITEKSWKQVYARIRLYEKMFGAYKRKYAEDGKTIVDDPITVDDVRKHIGLSTNVGQSTDAAWGKKVLRWATEEANRDISKAG